MRTRPTFPGISIYAGGMTVLDVCHHVHRVYGVDKDFERPLAAICFVDERVRRRHDGEAMAI